MGEIRFKPWNFGISNSETTADVNGVFLFNMLNHVHLTEITGKPSFMITLYTSQKMAVLYYEQWQEWGRPNIEFYMSLAIQTIETER